MNKIVLFSSLIIGTAFLYVFGPKLNFQKVNAKYTPTELKISDLNAYVKNKEEKITVKPGCNSKIVWANERQKKTEYAIVYLHGFSASPEEGYPVHITTAKQYGMNMYLPLLADHGIDSKESFANTTPQELVNSALEAIAIGKKLGDKIIVMSCSTGSTLANLIASENPGLIDGQIMYSPNFGLAKAGSSFSNNPWGLQILRLMFGSNYRSIPGADARVKKFWTHTYRLEGVVLTVELIEQLMSKNKIKTIDHPVFIGCYYKNDTEQDKVVSIPQMENFMNWISTSKTEKQMVRFNKVGGHVLTNPIYSKDVEGVMEATNAFIETVIIPNAL